MPFLIPIICFFLLVPAALAFEVKMEDAAPRTAAATQETAESLEPQSASGVSLLSPRQQTTLRRLEDYLTGLTTIAADFVQVSPQGEVVSGKFYFRRPGKMRWQYDPPTPVLMVTRGDFLTYYDYELDQVSDFPLNETLIGFLTRENIRFDTSVEVVSLEQDAGSIRVQLVQKSKPEEGRLTLEFSDSPLLLRNILIRDAAGQETTIALNNARFGIELDNGLFEFRDPRLSGSGPGGRHKR